MAGDFYRNQNLSERTTRLNALSDRVGDVEDRVDDIAVAMLSTGGAGAGVYDPGDLSVYYQNGKA